MSAHGCRFQKVYAGYARIELDVDQSIYIGGGNAVVLGRRGISIPETVLCRFDVRTSDREYWASVRVKLREIQTSIVDQCKWPSGKGDWWQAAYKKLRQSHEHSKRRHWDEVLPKEIVAWASTLLEAMSAGEPCVDNYRVARVGNSSQGRRYARQVKAGCCGFRDFEATGPDGKRYRLGFNYGH